MTVVVFLGLVAVLLVQIAMYVRMPARLHAAVEERATTEAARLQKEVTKRVEAIAASLHVVHDRLEADRRAHVAAAERRAREAEQRVATGVDKLHQVVGELRALAELGAAPIATEGERETIESPPSPELLEGERRTIPSPPPPESETAEACSEAPAPTEDDDPDEATKVFASPKLRVPDRRPPPVPRAARPSDEGDERRSIFMTAVPEPARG
jgi:hypothetical protein